MGIGGDVAVAVLDEDEIAVAFQVAGIGDGAVGGGVNGRAHICGDIDAVIALAVLIRAVSFENFPFDRPFEGARRFAAAIARTLVNPTAPMPSFANLQKTQPDKFNAMVAFLGQLKGDQ